MKEPSLVPETSASANSAILAGAPDRIRTCGLPSRSRTLYPLSYKRKSANIFKYTLSWWKLQEGIAEKFVLLLLYSQNTCMRLTDVQMGAKIYIT